MAEKAKEKKVTVREILREELAILIMEARGMERIGRTKEGLVVEIGEETVVVKTILKKDRVEKKDIVEILELAKLVKGEEISEEVETEATAG